MGEALELAREAFATQNFDLAADVYERSIQTSGPSQAVYLSLGDCYAKAGDFKKAFHSYTQAFKLGKVKPEQLRHLVDGLVEFMTSKGEELKLVPKVEPLDIFSCVICRSLLIDPVVIPCGHAFCRKCLEKDGTKTCKKCKVVHYHMCLKSTKTNVVISALLDKLFFPEVNAVKLKSEGNQYFQNGQYSDAIEAYTSALKFAPNDHLVVSNRSHAYAALGKNQDALKDGQLAIQLRPDWPKAYYRKGSALSGLGQHEDACLAFLQCLALDPMVVTAKTALAKELHALLSPIMPLEAESLKHMELRQAINPTPWAQLLSGQGERHLTAETVIRVKTLLRDSLVKAGLAEHDQENKGRESPRRSQSPTPEKSEQQRELSPRCLSAPTSRTPSPLSSPCLSHHRCHSTIGATGLEDETSRCCRKRARNSDSESSPTENLARYVKSKLTPESSPQSEESKPAGVSQISPSEKLGRKFDESVLSTEDLECSLCFRLFYMPVATPCGHVFCRQCLDRCLDHNTFCPLCKSSLAEHLAERRQSVIEIIDEVVVTCFPQQYQERKKNFEDEMAVLVNAGKDDQHEIPVFVCSLAFPTIACPLHVFEPRYRLMVRQCMESGTRQFGMCLPAGDSEGSFANHGTMLEIRDVQYFPDGRSLVDTIGGRRFKVLSRGVREGYNTAKIQIFGDELMKEEETAEIQKLGEEVYNMCKEWFNSLPAGQQGQVFSHFGQFPNFDNDSPVPGNGPRWVWWMVAIMPLDPRAQSAFITMTTLKERLKALKNIIQFLTRQRRQ